MASGDKAKLITPGYIDASGQPDGWFFDHSDTDVPAVELTSQEVVRVSGFTINELRQLSAYNPMHIPDWWHEEYLKSLEPNPPQDCFFGVDLLPGAFARFDKDMIRICRKLGNVIHNDRLLSILSGAFIGSLIMFALSGYWEAIPLGAGFGILGSIRTESKEEPQ